MLRSTAFLIEFARLTIPIMDDLVDEGKELIRKRQKPIRIADKSAGGWRVVDEYVSEELASGSEDEKRLRALLCKNQTYRGKGGKFDFFLILMLDRLGYS